MVLNVCWKLASDASVEPPSQANCWRSGGAMTSTVIEGGASADSSLQSRSVMPGNMVDPPDSTTLAYRRLRTLASHLMIELWVSSWMPGTSL